MPGHTRFFLSAVLMLGVSAGCDDGDGSTSTLGARTTELSSELEALDSLVHRHHGRMQDADDVADARAETERYLQDADAHHLAMEHAVADMHMCLAGDAGPHTAELFDLMVEIHEELDSHAQHVQDADDLDAMWAENDRHQARMSDLAEEIQGEVGRLTDDADRYHCAGHDDGHHGGGHGPHHDDAPHRP